MARTAKEAPASADLFPVKLMKNYRPVGEFSVIEYDNDGKASERKPDGTPETDAAMATGEFAKVARGTIIKINMTEARMLLDKRLAERADALPS